MGKINVEGRIRRFISKYTHSQRYRKINHKYFQYDDEEFKHITIITMDYEYDMTWFLKGITSYTIIGDNDNDN